MIGQLKEKVSISDFADSIAFGHISIDPSKHGYEFRSGKNIADCIKARDKAFNTPPFATESHLSLLEGYLSGIVKKKKS